jgi:hypothetical protein
MEADKNECENIFTTIGSKAKRTDIRFCRGLGERGEDARPLLLGMTSETVKCEILDRAKELQNTEYQHIGIGLDQTRCSSDGAKMADQLSKARFGQFRQTAAAAGWRLDTAPARIPAVLLRWLDRPYPCDALGGEILKENGARVPLAGYSEGYDWSAG